MGRKLHSSTLEHDRRRAAARRHADGRRSRRGHRRQGARLPGAQRARLDPQRRRITSATSAAAARPSCCSAKASTTTSTTCSAIRSPRRTTVMDATRDMIAAATRANVAIYARRSARPWRRVRGPGVDPVVPRRHHARPRHVVDLQRGAAVAGQPARDGRGDRRLRGRQPATTSATAFQRIVDDNSSYYVMGYYSTNDRRDGRFRKIEVQAAGQARPHGARAQGLRRAARQGAGDRSRRRPNGPSPELQDAMESPLPLTGLPLALTAAVFKGPAPKGSVVISTFIAGSTLPFAENDGMFKNDLEVARRRDRRQGQVVLDRSQHGQPEHEARHRQARRRPPASASSSRSTSRPGATTCASPCAKATRARPAR